MGRDIHKEVLDDIPIDTEGFAKMFPHLSQKNIDALLELYGDGSTVIDVVLNAPNLEQLIEKVKAQIPVKENEARLDECDEEDMFSVLEFYKSPQFDPRKSFTVRFCGQPSVEVGGVRRQMFTNVFTEFITSKTCLPISTRKI